MSNPKPVYSPQYRQQLVELVLAGRSANDVAKEFGLHATTVAKWVRLDRLGAPRSLKPSSAKASSGPLNANERQELIELRRKLRQVQMERDILAKATAWFAGKSEKTSIASNSSRKQIRPNYRCEPCAKPSKFPPAAITTGVIAP